MSFSALLIMLLLACAQKPSMIDSSPSAPEISLNDQLKEIDRMSREGRHDEALAELEPLIAAHPETQRPRGLKTDIFLRKGEYRKALDLQREIIAAIPDKWYAHYHLGLIYLEYLNQYSNAIDSIEAARTLLEADGDSSTDSNNQYNLFVSLAKAYDKGRQYDKSLEYCEKILEMRPNDPWTTTFQEMVKDRMEKLEKSPNGDDDDSEQ